MHDDQWESVVERGVAVGGLLRLDGGARLLDACFFSSRNIELFYGESFLQTVFNQQQPIAVAVARFSADGWRQPVRERHVPSRRRWIRDNFILTP